MDYRQMSDGELNMTISRWQETVDRNAQQYRNNWQSQDAERRLAELKAEKERRATPSKAVRKANIKARLTGKGDPASAVNEQLSRLKSLLGAMVTKGRQAGNSPASKVYTSANIARINTAVASIDKLFGQIRAPKITGARWLTVAWDWVEAMKTHNLNGYLGNNRKTAGEFADHIEQELTAVCMQAIDAFDKYQDAMQQGTNSRTAEQESERRAEQRAEDHWGGFDR